MSDPLAQLLTSLSDREKEEALTLIHNCKFDGDSINIYALLEKSKEIVKQIKEKVNG